MENPTEIALLRQEVTLLRQEGALSRQEVAELKTLVGELVLAFNTARGVVKFVKYLSAVVIAVSGAIGSVYALFHLGGTK